MIRELSQRVGGVEYAVDRLIERLEILAEDSAERFEAFERRMDERSKESARQIVEFREEMAEFRERMDESDRRFAAFEKRMDEANKQHRREQGQLSNKMGTLVEDLVAPSIPRVLREVVNCEEDVSTFAVRLVKQIDGRTQEYDVVAVCGEYMLINETKGRLRPEDIPKFQEVLYEARTFLPEYADKKIVGTMASLYLNPNLVVQGERAGLIMLGATDGIMELHNTDYFKPRIY